MTYSQLQYISLMSYTLSHDETLDFGLAISLGWLIQKREMFLWGRILPQNLIFLLQSPPECLSDPWAQCLLVSVHFLFASLHCRVTVWTILAHLSAHQTSDALGFSCCFVRIPLWCLQKLRLPPESFCYHNIAFYIFNKSLSYCSVKAYAEDWGSMPWLVWLTRMSAHRPKLTGSIPGQGMYLGCRFPALVGAHARGKQ